MGVYEVVPIVPSITRLIEAREPETAIRRQARAEGFTTLLQDVLAKVAAGGTSPDEVLRVVQVSSETTCCPGCQKEFAADVAACPYCGTAPATARETVAALAAVASPVAPSPAAPPPSTPIAPRTFKVLVVDDNASIRHLVRTVLETSGLDLTVISAQDGREALTLTEIEHPDLVLLDVSMPDLDGFEVCRRLRATSETAALPVIMLTAMGGEEHVEEGFGSGADDYVAKPFRRNELIARVRRMLERTYGKEAVRAVERPSAPPVPSPTEPR
jgi:CheY-like chemotaxis protein